jgi:hypothetical protein
MLDWQLCRCIDTTTQDALTITGFQGGLHTRADDACFRLGESFLPYFYHVGHVLMPDDDTFRKQLARCVDDLFKERLSDIRSHSADVFPDTDINFTHSTPSTKCTIQKTGALFEIDMQLNLRTSHRTVSVSLKDRRVFRNSILYDCLEIARWIADSHREDPNMIAISVLSEMAEERNLHVLATRFANGQDTTLYVIKSMEDMPWGTGNYIFGGELYLESLENPVDLSRPYMFLFLNKYPPSEDAPREDEASTQVDIPSAQPPRDISPARPFRRAGRSRIRGRRRARVPPADPTT